MGTHPFLIHGQLASSAPASEDYSEDYSMITSSGLMSEVKLGASSVS